jgi:AAA+ lid domain
VPKEILDKVQDEKAQTALLVRLWVHESLRVFSDRLINEEDKSIFIQCLKDTVEADS